MIEIARRYRRQALSQARRWLGRMTPWAGIRQLPRLICHGFDNFMPAMPGINTPHSTGAIEQAISLRVGHITTLTASEDGTARIRFIK